MKFIFIILALIDITYGRKVEITKRDIDIVIMIDDSDDAMYSTYYEEGLKTIQGLIRQLWLGHEVRFGIIPCGNFTPFVNFDSKRVLDQLLGFVDPAKYVRRGYKRNLVQCSKAVRNEILYAVHFGQIRIVAYVTDCAGVEEKNDISEAQSGNTLIIICIGPKTDWKKKAKENGIRVMKYFWLGIKSGVYILELTEKVLENSVTILNQIDTAKDSNNKPLPKESVEVIECYQEIRELPCYWSGKRCLTTRYWVTLREPYPLEKTKPCSNTNETITCDSKKCPTTTVKTTKITATTKKRTTHTTIHNYTTTTSTIATGPTTTTTTSTTATGPISPSTTSTTTPKNATSPEKVITMTAGAASVTPTSEFSKKSATTGTYSKPTDDRRKDEDDFTTDIIIGVVVSVVALVLLIAAIILVVLLMRRGKQKKIVTKAERSAKSKKSAKGSGLSVAQRTQLQKGLYADLTYMDEGGGGGATLKSGKRSPQRSTSEASTKTGKSTKKSPKSPKSKSSKAKSVKSPTLKSSKAKSVKSPTSKSSKAKSAKSLLSKSSKARSTKSPTSKSSKAKSTKSPTSKSGKTKSVKSPTSKATSPTSSSSKKSPQTKSVKASVKRSKKG